MNNVESKVFKELGSLRGEPSRIEEDERQKTPDFYYEDNKSSYVIELKSKESSQEEWDKIENELRSGVAEHVKPVERVNTISGIIHNACKQLASGARSGDFSLVWLHASGISEDAQIARFKASIYGTATLIELPDPTEGSQQDTMPYVCFFFSDSDFFLRRELLDGVFISSSRGYQLHINPYSNSSDKLRQSELAKEVPSFYIYEYEGKDRPLIADTDIDRKQTYKVLLYIREKYDLGPLSAVNEYHYNNFVSL